MLGLGSSLAKGGASLLTYVKDNLKLYLDFKSNKSDTLKFPCEGSTSFDGNNDRIDCGQIDVSGQGITFSAWIYRDGTTDDAVVGRWNSNGAMLYAGGANIMLYINGNNTFTSTPDKTWFHIAGTFDGANRKIYKNGVLEDIDADTGTIVNPSENFEIGNAEFSSGKGFKGKLANVAMWSRALTQEEVQSIMNKSYSQLKGVEKTSLVSWWSLDSAQVNTAESDHTGLFTLASNTTNSSVAVSNGEFELGNTTDWSTSASKSFTVTNGIARSVANGTTTLAVNKSVTGLTAGKVYKFEIKHYSDGGNTNMAYMSGVTGSIDIPSSLSITTFYHVAPATSFSLNWYAHGASEDEFIEIHYVRVEEVPMAGKVTGATTTTSVYGGNAPILPRAVDVAKEGQADAIGNGSASFNGSSDFVQVADAQVLQTNDDMTITAWVNPTGTTTNRVFLQKRDSGGTNYQFYISGNQKIRFFDGSTATSSTSTVTNDEWQHVAISINSGVSNGSVFYLNGIADGTATFTITADDAPVTIGKHQIDNSYYNGLISQLGLWQGALTQAQIQSVMESTSYSKIPADVKSTTTEKLPSPDLTSGTGLTITQGSTGTLTHDTTAGTITATDDVQDAYLRWYSAGLEENKLYKLEIVVDSYTGGRFRKTLGWNGTNFYPTVGTNIQYFIGSSTSSFGIQFDDGNPAEFVISKISVKEVINDLVAYYPLDGSSSRGNGTDDATTGEVLGDELADTTTYTGGSNGSEFYIRNSNVPTLGGIYKLTFDVDSYSSGSFYFTTNTGSNPRVEPSVYSTTNSSIGSQNGSETYYLKINVGGGFKFKASGTYSANVSNISLKEITSNTGVLY